MKNGFFKLLLLWGTLYLFACGNGGTGSPEATAWEQARKENTMEALDSFLIQFPETGRKKEIATLRDGMLYQTALLSNTEYYYRQYLQEFPQGKYVKEIQEKLNTLPNDAVGLSELSAKTFVGTIRQGDRDYDVLALKFKEIEESGDNINFIASVHLSSDIRKQLKGSILKPTFSISFEEDKDDEFMLDLSDGRAYIRNGQILIESIDPKQFWHLK